MKRVIIGLLLLLACGICIWQAVLLEAEDKKIVTGYTYEGKVLLTNEQYDNFKGIVAQGDVEIRDLEVYSSDKHLVIFTVHTPAYIDNFYGERISTDYTFIHTEAHKNFSLVGVLCGFAGLGLLISLLGKDMKWEGTQ